MTSGHRAAATVTADGSDALARYDDDNGRITCAETQRRLRRANRPTGTCKASDGNAVVYE